MAEFPANGFKTFKEFYPYYLSEHLDKTCRIFHFVGTSLVIGLMAWLTASERWSSHWWTLPLAGYGFAWAGHFFFEKNRPATFKAPLYSLMGDFVMFFQLLTGKLSFSSPAKPKLIQ